MLLLSITACAHEKPGSVVVIRSGFDLGTDVIGAVAFTAFTPAADADTVFRAGTAEFASGFIVLTGCTA